MSNNRDEFPQKVKEILRARVANRCSYPHCRVPTTGPTTLPDKVNNIGKAAHICAAAKGGPRYDPTMTKQQRKSIDNAIWLCSNCSTIIDNDETVYTVELLKKWKHKAEDRANKEIGNKLPDNNETINTLTTAFSGQSTMILHNAIPNVCQAISNRYELLDPRLDVETSYFNKTTHFSISAKESVETKIQVDKKYKNEFLDKYINLLEHGETLNIPSDAITITGSKLLEELTQNVKKGQFSFIPTLEKPAIQKIWVFDPDNHLTKHIDDIQGKVILGTKSFSFKGTLFNELLFISYRKYLQSDENLNIKFKIDFTKWNKIQLAFLPYFDSLYHFFEHLKKGWELNTKLEINGLEILRGGITSCEYPELFCDYYAILNFIHRVKVVCQYLNISINFQSDFSYSAELYEQILEIYNIISNDGEVRHRDISESATFTLIVGSDLDNLHRMTNSSCIKLEQTEANKIKLFGQELVLPLLSISLTNVSPKIKQNITSIKSGDKIEVECVPNKGCEYILKLL
ncbi:MAG TPA: hypothetical protein EYP59_00725 [Thiotrichaceae bacterium]|nr:hypothetical protein [Thiotrichaceae bacterium]